jgi:hypothetical protein
MKRFFSIAALSLLAALMATPSFADVTPKDVKDAGNEAAATIQKNKDQAVKKVAPKKKKRSFFGDNELGKDRSLPPGDKVQTTASDSEKKDPPYKNLGSELRKDRSK